MHLRIGWVQCVVAFSSAFMFPASLHAAVEYDFVAARFVSLDPTLSDSPVNAVLEWRVAVLDPLATTEVADADIQLFVNGSPVGSTSVTLELLAGSGDCAGVGCASPCGSALIDGEQVDLECDTGCTCHTPVISSPLASELFLNPGDVVEITISPTAGDGSIPPTSGTMDWGVWQRRVVASRVIPAPDGAEGLFEVSLDWWVEFEGVLGLPVDLGASIHGTVPTPGEGGAFPREVLNLPTESEVAPQRAREGA